MKREIGEVLKCPRCLEKVWVEIEPGELPRFGTRQEDSDPGYGPTILSTECKCLDAVEEGDPDFTIEQYTSNLIDQL